MTMFAITLRDINSVSVTTQKREKILPCLPTLRTIVAYVYRSATTFALLIPQAEVPRMMCGGYLRGWRVPKGYSAGAGSPNAPMSMKKPL